MHWAELTHHSDTVFSCRIMRIINQMPQYPLINGALLNDEINFVVGLWPYNKIHPQT